MRMYRTVVTIFVTLLAVGSVNVRGASAQDTLVGAWEVVSRSYTRAGSSLDRAAGAGGALRLHRVALLGSGNPR